MAKTTADILTKPLDFGALLSFLASLKKSIATKVAIDGYPDG